MDSPERELGVGVACMMSAEGAAQKQMHGVIKYVFPKPYECRTFGALYVFTSDPDLTVGPSSLRPFGL
jgi:hypothetical protein